MESVKVLLINEVCGYTSTGKICGEIANELSGKGHEVKIAYGRSSYVPTEYQKYAIRIGNNWTVRMHALQTRLFDMHGFGSKKATKKFLKWADNYDPDIIWLHNLHGYYINIEALFQWIKSHPEKEVKWTLHDCWAFTGHCVHFTMAKCNKWKTGCWNCPQKREYPASRWIDRSRDNYLKKKVLFCGVNNMKIMVPSQWLSDLVKDSFLGAYQIEVRHNTIDRNIFKPIKSDFRICYGLEDKVIILGVANMWEKRKGLEDFIQLSYMLDETYAIILVGLDEKRAKRLEKKVVRISGIKNIKKLEIVRSLSKNIESISETETNKQNNSNKKLAKMGKEKYSGGIAVPEKVECIYKEITGNDQKKEEADKFAMIYWIPKTKSKEKLAELYSAADYYVNPTHEDNFPTTNLEARACGTRVITYDVGGCKETLNCIDF